MSIVVEFQREHIHFPSGTIYIDSSVDSFSAEHVLKNLHMLDRARKDITLLINNSGGDVYCMFAIYDRIRQCSGFVTGEVYGEASSAASVILQACDKRRISKHSILMIHYGPGGAIGEQHPKITQAWMKQEEFMSKQMEDIYLEQIQRKHPSFKRAQLQKLLMFDTIYNAEQTVQLGLADEVIE